MKKKIVTVCLTAVLAATALIGGTMAYFTDTKEANNVFTVGNVKIKLDEAQVEQTEETWTANNDVERVTSNTYENVYPGAELPKDPTVTNTGNNNAYIRVKVTVSDCEAWRAIVGDNTIDSIFGQLGKGWTKTNTTTDKRETVTYTYTYSDVVASNGKTSPVFENVTIPATATSTQMEALKDGFTIDIVAEAIQAAGFDSVEDAFAAWK